MVYLVPEHPGAAVGSSLWGVSVVSVGVCTFRKSESTYMVTQVVVVARGVTDMDRMLQLEVRDSYSVCMWTFPAPMGI
jgi:hypothetical protein